MTRDEGNKAAKESRRNGVTERRRWRREGVRATEEGKMFIHMLQLTLESLCA